MWLEQADLLGGIGASVDDLSAFGDSTMVPPSLLGSSSIVCQMYSVSRSRIQKSQEMGSFWAEHSFELTFYSFETELVGHLSPNPYCLSLGT